MSADEAVRAALVKCPRCGEPVHPDQCTVPFSPYKIDRTHTLAGAGESENELRNMAVSYGDNEPEKAIYLKAADLIAAQRERIAELEGALKPFAEEAIKWKNIRNEEMRPVCAKPDPDEYGDADDAVFTVGDLRRARAALGRKWG